MFECEEDEARHTHAQATLWDSETLGFKGVVGAPLVVPWLKIRREDDSQERFSEFIKSSDPTGGLEVFRV